MRTVYSKPILKDLTQGSRISYVRQFRLKTQDEVSDMLGLTGECKRRTMTRYEKGERNPKKNRLAEIANILNVNINSIRKYDFSNSIDIVYELMWIEELFPDYFVSINKLPFDVTDYSIEIKQNLDVWLDMRNKYQLDTITYEEYINWKLTHNFEGDI